jgi:hypothetical protein
VRGRLQLQGCIHGVRFCEPSSCSGVGHLFISPSGGSQVEVPDTDWGVEDARAALQADIDAFVEQMKQMKVRRAHNRQTDRQSAL